MMRMQSSRARQVGAITIFSALTMLLLITAIVVSAFRMSTVNLRAVGNVQARDQAIAAAKVELEKIVGSPFTENPTAAANAAIGVDINNDAVNDITVAVDEPICERALRALSTASSSVTLVGFTPGQAYNTTWLLRATATEATTGANVAVIHRVRVLLNEVDKNAVCPDAV